MKILAAHFLFRFKLTLKHPAFMVSTIVFPGLFFWIFARPNAVSAEYANTLLASFTGFSLLSVIFLMFAVQTSQELATDWYRYVRTLPVSTWQIIGADILNALVYVLLAAAVVVLVVFQSTSADLPVDKIFLIFGLLILCSPPFVLLALILGNLISSQSILPVTNLTYLLLSFIGGLWIPPNALPESVKDISGYFPSRHLGEVLWAVVGQREIALENIYGLLIYTLISGAIVVWILRRRRARDA